MAMITEDEVNVLAERLVRRTEQANIYFLKKIGEIIKQIRDIRPTEAHQLEQMLLYGGNYEEIINKIKKYTNLSTKDIDDIFSSYAKRDQQFYKAFYAYKDVPFVEFAKNDILINQTTALAKTTQNEFLKFMRPKVLGYTLTDIDGVVRFKGLKEVYNRVVDEAILNVSQGKETYNEAMQKIMKELGGSGLKTIDFESGRSVRADSMVRQHIKTALKKLHTANEERIGEEIDFDGWEITTHSNPAPDHQYAQGRRFTIEEFNKLQKEGKAKDVNGKIINMHPKRKDKSEAPYFRPIAENNCYHTAFSVILGITKPEHTEEELKEIIDKNNKGFKYKGKKYTMYQGTQLQRQLETEIRKQKDIQIMAKESGDMDLVDQAQSRISVLLNKYKEVSDISGLPMKTKRLEVAGYKRTKIK